MHYVLVCGGRHYTDTATLASWLSAMQPTAVIHGEAPGADTIAGMWAHERGIPEQRFRANWDAEGRLAGPNRNQRMLDHLLSVCAGSYASILAMPGGTGTADMVRRGEQAGVPVFGPNYRTWQPQQPSVLLAWLTLSLSALRQEYRARAAPFEQQLQYLLDKTQNPEENGTRPVTEEEWTRAKALLRHAYV